MVFFKKGAPVTYFCPALDPSLSGSGRNSSTHVRGHEFLIPSKFRKHPSSGSAVKAEYVFTYIYLHWCTAFFHLNSTLTILKHLNLFTLLFFPLQTWKVFKINVDLTLYRIQFYGNSIKIRQLPKWLSPMRRYKRIKIVTSKWNQK